jgi:DNA modification methylase
MFNQIILGDCYELMKEIPDGSIDAIISDFPYNTTQAECRKKERIKNKKYDERITDVEERMALQNHHV